MDILESQLPSGRLVRYRILKPSETDKVLAAAADSLSPNATNPEFQIAIRREGAKAMVISITKDPAEPIVETMQNAALVKKQMLDLMKGFGAEAELEALFAIVDAKVKGATSTPGYKVDESAFEKLDADKWDDLSPKDDQILRALYSQNHEVSPGEVGAVLGKVRQLTT